MTDEAGGEALPAPREAPAPGAGRGAGGAVAIDRYRHLLLLRFVLVNFVGAALLAAAGVQGWVAMAVASDPTRLTLVISAVFAFGFALCGAKIVRTSRLLDATRAYDPARPDDSLVARYVAAVRERPANSRAISAEALRQRFAARIAVIRHVANSLVFLGLIGTVIGFIIALSGVQPDAVTDLDNVAPMVSTLIRGMSVALYTTLVGAVFSIWLMIDYRLLATGVVNLVNATIELGEAHARS